MSQQRRLPTLPCRSVDAHILPHGDVELAGQLRDAIDCHCSSVECMVDLADELVRPLLVLQGIAHDCMEGLQYLDNNIRA